MKVRWSKLAIQDLASIYRYIRTDNIAAARRVRTTISVTLTSLASAPHRGRQGEVEGTREIIFHPWQYIAVYRVLEDEVQILRVRHAAQVWP
jgi:addiction module RelE/StbE family toxin